MIAHNKRLIGMLGTVALLLCLPLVAMQFSNEVNWSGFDFAVAGTLLLGTVLLCEWVLRKVRATKQRLWLLAGILLALFLIWAELAVGVFGTPLAGS